MKRSFLVFAALFLASGGMLACNGDGGGGETKDNDPPKMGRILILPDQARPGDVVNANARYLDKEGDECRLEYQWMLGGEEIEGATGDSLDTKGLPPKGLLTVRVRAVEVKSGQASEWDESKGLTLGDLHGPPLAGVKLEPEAITIDQPVRAVIDYGDTDPMEVMDIYYRWYVNDTLVPFEEEVGADELPPTYYKKNDRVRVEVCTDGKFVTPGIWKSGIFKVVDAPPSFNGAPTFEFQGRFVIIYVDASDPEGQPVKVRLTQYPPGASAFAGSRGEIKLDLSKTRPGTYPVKIEIADPAGGKAEYSTTLTVPD